METLIANSYLTLFTAYTFQTDLVLSTAAFQHSATAANLGMVQMSKIPREPINNTASDAFSATYQEIWYTSYAAIKPAGDGLFATSAAGLNTSCVPRLPDNSCGTLFEMLKWEKRMENYHYNYGAWYFDSRLGRPVPGHLSALSGARA